VFILICAVVAAIGNTIDAMNNPRNEWHGGNYNDAFWHGFKNGAQVGSLIVSISHIVESFSGVAKTADGSDILKNHEALKQKGVGLDGVNFENGVPSSMVDTIDIKPMLNPTGLGIRNDSEGLGWFKAQRISNNEGHTGVDLLGEKVVAAHNGYLEVLDTTGYNTGVRITVTTYDKTVYSTIYQHINVTAKTGYVTRGTQIGIVKASANPNITPHVHFEVHKYLNGVHNIENPAMYIKIP
jgi:hypothetical protein